LVVTKEGANVMKTTGQKVKKLLVLPAALDKKHPLYIGYVGKKEKQNEVQY
jgi:hypothetical protein